jgi:1,4-dihydroxy-2-naphthoate octaprenyltransferase
MAGVGVWVRATRPRTLTVAVAPVLMGTAMAWRDGVLHGAAAAAALAGALLLQIGTNFANDDFDFRQGADTPERIGPVRAVAAGLVTATAMRRAWVLTFTAAAVVGAYLVARGGWPIAAIGLAGIACGVLYTGGPRPLGYVGLADGVAFAFFGPVAVAGTHYVQSLHWSAAAAVAGIGPGLLAVALLSVNNLRDAALDRVAGKRTLAVRFGTGFAKAEFTCALIAASLVPVILWLGFDGPAWVLAVSAACLLAAPAVSAVLRARPGDRLLDALGSVGRLIAVYGVVFALGWTLG